MAIIVKTRDSLLTTSSGYTNYRGILNLVIILLVLSNARAALENVIKYGILVDPLSWLSFFRQGSKHGPALLIVVTLSAHILLSYLIELFLKRVYKKELIEIANRNVDDRASVEANEHNSDSSKENCEPTSGPSKRLKPTNGAKNEANLAPSKVAPNDHKPGKELSMPLSSVLINFVLVTNLLACLSIPPMIVYTNDTHPISTSCSLMVVSIVFLKLVSYHMMNYWCRDIKLNGQQKDKLSTTTKSFLRSYIPPAVDFGENSTGDENSEPDQEAKTSTKPTLSPKLIAPISLKTLAKYPRNVTINDMVTYMYYPTLCYELEFAKTARIRKRFLIKRVVELIILSQLDMALIQQWIVPTVSNSVLPFRQMQLSHMLERLLKLAIPNHVIWLIWFYLFFHSLLNIIAELTRYADREFYRDWWNSESVYYFWSNWNIPVHKWCARHLYVPLMALGLSKCQASTAVFFVSAFFHEYLVSVPLKLFRMWAFGGMLIQLPWAKFVSAYFNHNFANIAVWVSLIIGQPLCILMYYHDYYVINNVNTTIVRSLPSR